LAAASSEPNLSGTMDWTRGVRVCDLWAIDEIRWMKDASGGQMGIINTFKTAVMQKRYIARKVTTALTTA
jgi:hypothetical protein